MLKITFFSNFLNHHQLPFCLEMVAILGDNFKFVATERINQERLELGYEDMNNLYDFVVRSYDNEEDAYKLGLDSDVVIIGSAPTKFIKQRLKYKKLTFRYSERIHRNGINLKSVFSIFIKRAIFERNNVYLLCSSAFSAYDYSISHAYIDKCYKWAYFTEVKKYENINKLMKCKKNNTILWVARFINVKHPEVVIELAKRLKKSGYIFIINMIGIGELKRSIEQMIIDNDLSDNIKLLGSMPPEKVRERMEESKIFLFTSDRGEGWGAVLNESMNSGCAVVASHEIGSVPFLIKDQNNGLVYIDGNINDLYNKVKLLLDNSKLCNKLGVNAYRTIVTTWNPKVAAERIIQLSKCLMQQNRCDNYLDGPCSRAEIIKDNWYFYKR